MAAALLAILAFPGIVFAQEEFRVSVLGAVKRPGNYTLSKGDKLSALIEKAGGYADNVFLRGAILTRESAKETQAKTLAEIVARNEAQLFAEPAEAERKRDFLDSLGKLPPNGRIPVRLAHPRLLKGSDRDLLLEAGDTLYIPPQTNEVAVTGAVKDRSRSAYPYSAKAGYKDYVKMAGGIEAEADRNQAYLLAADGSVKRLSRGVIDWNPSESRWEIPAFAGKPPAIEPGDTIVVPKKPSAPWARRLSDLPSLLRRIHEITGTRIDAP